MNKKFGALSSSQNPQKLAAWVSGLILSLSSIIILLATKWFGLSLTPDDIGMLSTQVGAIVGAIATVFGIVRHIVATIAEKKTSDLPEPQG